MAIFHHDQAQKTNILHHLTLSKLFDLAEPTRKIDDYRSHCLIHTQKKCNWAEMNYIQAVSFFKLPSPSQDYNWP